MFTTNNSILKEYYVRIITFLIALSFISCEEDSTKFNSFEDFYLDSQLYKIESGFNLEIVASEPLVESPVAIDFDNKGRIWAVEMKGYMSTIDDTGSDEPIGAITILEDVDEDGIMDNSKIFIDSLVLPRAIAHVYNGLLYAEPPNLWFVDIVNDKPINKILVDSLYTDSGNVEHQSNGLMMHIDNWIYNAKSNYRYQKKDGKWLKEPTTFRGQWGISKDNFGRLYYNTNSVQLMGDYILPNTIIKNQYFSPKESLERKLTEDQNVFPLHPTFVNRGYIDGILDEDSLLVNVTSACAPLIYRGNNYSSEYLENAFVCVPEANLIKRNVLEFKPDGVYAKQAIPEKEFIMSTDDGFRPVNLNNGPDGNMYIVDMHRGVIQGKAYMSPYLKNHLLTNKMDTIIGMGRILRVVNNNKTVTETINLNNLNINYLISLLNNSNGWLRDRAQQILIYKNDSKAIISLIKLLNENNKPLTEIHILHTLNGLNALNFKVLKEFIMRSNNSSSIIHAFTLLEQFANKDNAEAMVELIRNISLRKIPEIDLYIMNSIGNWIDVSKNDFFTIALRLSNKYRKNKIFQESLISSLRGHEEDFLSVLSTSTAKRNNYNSTLNNMLNSTIINKRNNKKSFIYTEQMLGADDKTAGYKIFKNLCATCHGVNGSGIEGLAPPLINSSFVTDSSERLSLIILHGLTGPVNVNGKLYDLGISMPGLVNNEEFDDKDIQNIIEYLRNAFPGEAERLEIEEIKDLRNKKPKNGHAFTEEELMKY